MTKLCPKFAICGLFIAASALSASAASTIDEVFSEGKVSLNTRLRYEHATQPGVNNSDALTLRNRLGFTSGKFNGFQFMLEGEDVTAVDSDSYNQGGLNPAGAGQVVIAEVEGTEINQVWLAYASDSAKTTVGRQRIVLDNARFIGDVGWRQDQQTYDAFTFSNTAVDKLTLTYGYLWQINRIFSNKLDWESDSHLFNASYKGLPAGEIAAYAYLLDFDNAKANSCATYGLSFSGSTKFDGGAFLYRLEAATQSDYGSSALTYSATYYVAELGAKLKAITVKAGYEVLGSDNGVGFKTPLATLHAFNGFADLFLGTPAGGLKDIYASIAGSPVKGLNLAAFYHDFQADVGGADYGTEIDLVASYKFAARFTGIAKFASFNSDGFAKDTDRLSFEVNFAY